MHRKKTLKIIFASLLLLLMVGTLPSSQKSIANGKENLPIGIDTQEKEPPNQQVGNYINNQEGSGKSLNTTLHQALDNTTSTSHKANSTWWDADDVGFNNTIEVTAPPSFNTSFSSINFTNLYAPNRSITIQDGGVPSPTHQEFYASFQVPTKCFLEDFEIRVAKNPGLSAASMQVDIFRSYEVSGTPYPHSSVSSTFVNNNFGTGALAPYWFQDFNNHIFIDPEGSSCYNNTFFFHILCSGGGAGPLNYHYNDDAVDGDQSIVYDSSGSTLATEFGADIDINIKFKVAPAVIGGSDANIVNATAVDLQVNNSIVEDWGSALGTALWNSTLVASNETGSLNFTFRAAWWDVTFTVNRVLINYTYQLDAVTTFAIDVNDAVATWNASWNAGTLFSSQFSNHTINVTIPTDWTVLHVTNTSGATGGHPFVSSGDGPPGYKNITVYWDPAYPADVDSMNDWWNLTATQDNLLSGADAIRIAVGLAEVTEVEADQVLNITADFSSVISASGMRPVNLSVYSPYELGGLLNYTQENTTLTSQTRAGFPLWTLYDNVTAYGEFACQVYWANETHVAYREENVTIIGVTNFYNYTTHPQLLQPDVDSFTIKFSYNESHPDLTDDENGIASAWFFYTYDTIVDFTTLVADDGSGNYSVQVNFADVSWGAHYINITGGAPNYNNITFQYEFQWENASYQFIDQADVTVVRSENYTFYLEYYGWEPGPWNITGATWWASEESGFETWLYEANNGTYRLEINSSLVPGRTTPYEIRYEASKPTMNFLNQTYVFNVLVMNRTEIKVLGMNQTSYSDYDDAIEPLEVFYGSDTTIRFVYNDTDYGPAGKNITVGADLVTNITWDGTEYDSPILNGEVWEFLLDIDTYPVGNNYKVTLEFNGTYINITTLDVYFNIIPCPTNWTITLRQDTYGLNSLQKVGNYYHAYYGADIQFVTTFLNNKSGADITASPLVTFDHSLGAQTFTTATGTINTGAMGIGTYTLNLKFNGTNFENYSVSVTIEVLACPTLFSVAVSYETTGYTGLLHPTASSYEMDYGAQLNFVVTYKNAFTGADVSVGTGTVTIGTQTFDGNGVSPTILLAIGTNAVGSYTIQVSISTTNYETNGTTLTLAITECPVTFALQSVFTQGSPDDTLSFDETGGLYSGSYDKNVTLAYTVTNPYTGAAVTGATFTAKFGDTVFTGVEDSKTPGRYLVIIDYSKLEAGKTAAITLTWTLANYQTQTREVKIFLQAPGGGGLPVWILYLLGIVGALVAVSVGTYKGIIQPKKQRRTEELTRSATSFEDAINLLHILVIYKQTGTCIYFKSFAQEQINPDLISGFLQAVQTFGTELKTETKSLDEMKYGEDTLLMSDGELVRTTLVLGRPPSQYQRGNLSRFTISFEDKFREVLLNWKGQLGIFQEADQLVDNVLNASIILPHQINENIEGMKALKESLSKPLLKLAQQMVGPDRPFFFIASLVQQGVEELSKDPQEVLIAIEDLRKNTVFVPLDISALEAPQISQQEMQLLQQKVQALPDFSPEEKAKLVEDLSKLDPVEREAAIASLQAGRQSVTSTKEGHVQIKRLADAKEAEKEIKRIEKEAKKAVKDKLYDKALDLYRAAELTAFQWNLTSKADEIRASALDVQVKNLELQREEIVNQAKQVVKDEMFAKGAELYKQAALLSSDIFKLGIPAAEKDVKKYNKMSSTCAAKAGTLAGPGEGGAAEGETQVSKKSLMKMQKKLLSQVKDLKKSGDKAALAQLYLDLATVSDELFKFGVSAEAANVKKYRALWKDTKAEVEGQGEE